MFVINAILFTLFVTAIEVAGIQPFSRAYWMLFMCAIGFCVNSFVGGIRLFMKAESYGEYYDETESNRPTD